MARTTGTSYFSSGHIVVDGGDNDQFVTSEALADGAATHTVASGTPDLTTPHASLCVARGITVTVTDASGSGLSAAVTVTGTSINGGVLTETFTALTDSTGTGTIYFGTKPFKSVTAVTSVSTGYAAGDLIKVGEGAAYILPTTRQGQAWRFEVPSGTDAAVIALNGTAATTAGNANVANYTDQLVLENGANRGLSNHEVGYSSSGLFSVIADVLESGACTLRFEVLGFGPDGE